ncbi:hypothetical protein [Arthrobacter woluwensis]|uniref:hypothetical protein n=1 Tax=Arthrobacter woluwensis TaxID=156980 RepID=UPI001AAE55CF|nr:hypothetical protein [Arthrobacter woluwensis]QTF73432.1 hypothetical protein G8758_16520 [Arthrobacter woluwensis]
MRLLTTKIMLGAALACAALLIQTVLAPETLGLVLLLVCAFIGFVCAIASVAILRRNKVLLAAGILTTVAVTFALAYVRLWGLGFSEGYDRMHTTGPGAGSDLYFFLSLAAGLPAALLLFLGSVWPVKKPGVTGRKRPTRTAGGRSARPAGGATGRSGGSRSTARTVVRPAAPRRTPGARPDRPAPPRASRSQAR